MSIRAKLDAEKLMIEVKNRIVNEFNDKLAEITLDKAKDSTNIVLTDFKKLGGGIVGQSGGDGAEVAIDILGARGAKFESYNPYMIIKFVGDGMTPVDGLGRDVVNLMILITMIDPNDYTGEIRMLRYRRAIKEIFEAMGGKKTANISLSAIETLPFISGPDFKDKTKNRLTWGVGLRFTI